MKVVKTIYETLLFGCLLTLVLVASHMIGESRRQQHLLEQRVEQQLETTDKKVERAEAQVDGLTTELDSLKQNTYISSK